MDGVTDADHLFDDGTKFDRVFGLFLLLFIFALMFSIALKNFFSIRLESVGGAVGLLDDDGVVSLASLVVSVEVAQEKPAVLFSISTDVVAGKSQGNVAFWMTRSS